MFANFPARHTAGQHQLAGPSILSAGDAQSLLDGLVTPHASQFMYRPRPALDRSVTAPAVIPGLGFHVVPPRQPQPVSPAADLFSPSIYSSSSLPSPLTDSLPSPVSSHSGEEHAEDDARAWSGTPEWDDDDNYNSPVWGSRWARRQDSTVSDSLWGSADGSDSLFGGSLSADGGRKDASRSLDGLAARSLSTDSSAGGQLTDGGGRLFLPAAPRTYTRRSESSVGSLFRFAGPAIAISASSASPVEPDGWEDLSTAISDEVHYDGGGGGGAYGSYQSSLRLSSNHRASYDSAFAFDGPTRRPSNDSFLAPPPAQLPRRAPIHGGSLVPAAPANAGAELLFRRNSAGSFSDYQMRRASFERRTSVGSHPLVTAVDPLFSPELELLPAEQLSAPTAADRRVSTVSELEREDRLAFLMILQRRVSQVVEVQPGGRQYAIDQWEMDRQAIQSAWSPSTVGSDLSPCLDGPDHGSQQEMLSPALSTDDDDAEPSPSSKYETLHKNISLTFSFEERLSPFSQTVPLPADDELCAERPSTASDTTSLFRDGRLPDLSPRPMFDTYSLAQRASQLESTPPMGRSAKLLAAFSGKDDDSEGETDVGHGASRPGTSDCLFGVEIATLRRVELRTAAVTQTPPLKTATAFDHDDDAATPFDMGYLADMVRILPTPHSSISASHRGRPQEQVLATQLPADDDFAPAFGRPTSSPADAAPSLPPDTAPARAPTPSRLRAVQSLSSLTTDLPLPSPSSTRSKFDRMATFLSTSTRPLSELSSERSISPFSRPRPPPATKLSPSSGTIARTRRNAGAWDLPWGAQLQRSSVRSSVDSAAGADLPVPVAAGRRTSYISQTAPPAPPSAAFAPSDAVSRRPSTAGSLLPFQDTFVKQSLALRRDSEVKVHVVSSDSPPESPPDRPPPVPPKPQQRLSMAFPASPTTTQQKQQQSHVPETCVCPLFYNRIDGKRVPVAHPAHAPPPLPPYDQSRSDPILSPSARAHSTVHARGGESPVRFAVPRKQAPPRPPMPQVKMPSESAVSLETAGPLRSPPLPELKKRRSRAVLSRLFTKRDKGDKTGTLTP